MLPLLMNLIPTVSEGVFWVDPVVNMYSGIEPGSHTRNRTRSNVPEKDNALEAGGRTHMATERPEGGNKKILGHYSEITSPLLLKRFFGTSWAIPWHFFGTTLLFCLSLLASHSPSSPSSQSSSSSSGGQFCPGISRCFVTKPISTPACRRPTACLVTPDNCHWTEKPFLQTLLKDV